MNRFSRRSFIATAVACLPLPLFAHVERDKELSLSDFDERYQNYLKRLKLNNFLRDLLQRFGNFTFAEALFIEKQILKKNHIKLKPYKDKFLKQNDKIIIKHRTELAFNWTTSNDVLWDKIKTYYLGVNHTECNIQEFIFFKG